MIAYVGIYSYGFYLVHQPYVIYFGARIRDLNMAEFAIAAIPLIACLAYASSWFERAVNAIADRILEGPGRSVSGSARIRAASAG